nr:MAG TPA: hypothetical protein [Caudoviricetes sp.]
MIYTLETRSPECVNTQGFRWLRSEVLISSASRPMAIA